MKKAAPSLVCPPHPPFCLGLGGVNLLLNFQKGGWGGVGHFERGLLEKRRVTFLEGGGGGGYNFYKKNELKSITFNKKKSFDYF